MKKIFLSIAVFLLIAQSVFAKGAKSDINTVISDSGISKNSISISVKNLSNEKTVYELNSKVLNHPASVQKMLTLPAAMSVLGEDYRFTTELYTRGANGYLIKLGADPYFTSDNLSGIVRKINPTTVKQIYIDDSIIELKDWGEGWQWDDNMNSCMPKYNSFNLDGNIAQITIMPTQQGAKPLIINPSNYPIVFLNNAKTADKNNISVVRDNSITENAILIKGTISSPITISIPISNLKRYFEFKLTQSLENEKIYLKNPYINTVKNTSDKKTCQISHPISIAVDDILKNSNNMAIETVMKLAGGKYRENKEHRQVTGTDYLGLEVFDEYCRQIGIDPLRVKLVDASGVSKNNLVDADFITDYLIKSKDNKTLKHLPKPGEGTLSERMIPLKDNLLAKTGTLSDVSSIAGYLTSKSGKQYAFCIIINDPKSTNSEKKVLEDYIIKAIYFNK